MLAVWTTIGVLRTVSSMLIWEACGRQMLVLPLIAMMTHLVGDSATAECVCVCVCDLCGVCVCVCVYVYVFVCVPHMK